jgi:exosortase
MTPSASPTPRPAPPPAAPALVALLPAWLAVLWLVSRVRWVWNEQPEMQFGWIVLMLAAYLIWESWESRPPTAPRPGWLGPTLGALALGLIAVVQVYQAAFGTNAASLCGHALGTVLLATANLHLVFGPPGVRRFLFPFLFLLVAMPMPSAIHGPVTSHLQGLVATFNVETLNLLGIPAQRIGSLIQLPNGTVGVNEACSGIRSLQSSVMATLFIGHLSLHSNLLRTLLFLGGIATAVTGNILRSLYLSLTAHTHGLASVDKVHDAAGWSILVFTAVGVGLLAWYLGRIESRLDHPSPPAPTR